MKFLLTTLFVLLAGALAAPLKEGGSPARSPRPAVESYDTVDAAEFNATLEAARAAGAEWAGDPYQVVLRYLRPWPEPPVHLDMEMEGMGGESPSGFVVTAVQEGLHDDSLAGIWQRITLQREPGGGWSIRQVQRAFLCARGANTKTYHRDLCP